MYVRSLAEEVKGKMLVVLLGLILLYRFRDRRYSLCHRLCYYFYFFSHFFFAVTVSVRPSLVINSSFIFAFTIHVIAAVTFTLTVAFIDAVTAAPHHQTMRDQTGNRAIIARERGVMPLTHHHAGHTHIRRDLPKCFREFDSRT